MTEIIAIIVLKIVFDAGHLITAANLHTGAGASKITMSGWSRLSRSNRRLIASSVLRLLISESIRTSWSSLSVTSSRVKIKGRASSRVRSRINIFPAIFSRRLRASSSGTISK
jgi:hypothetical protein